MIPQKVDTLTCANGINRVRADVLDKQSTFVALKKSVHINYITSIKDRNHLEVRLRRTNSDRDFLIRLQVLIVDIFQ